MSPQYFYRVPSRNVPNMSGRTLHPNTPGGKPATGRIVNLLVGQGHGYIRVTDMRRVYFHRSDLQDGTAFNDLQIGDAVQFELLEDAVSGARALRVVRRKQAL
jgi:hypothetical protein